MGFWGWRPLLITVFVSVWIVGCTLINEYPVTPTLTPYPRVTLTVGRIGPPSVSMIPSATAVIPTSTPTSEAPTPEPVALATPVLYAVQAGDTLLDIAIRFDVGLDALRQANAEADLSLLHVGQQIIVPQPTPQVVTSTESDPSSGTTPVPQALIVQLPSCFILPTNAMLCMGRVDNPLEQAVERISIAVQLSSEDSLVYEHIAVIEQAVIPPSSFAPYRVLFTSDEISALGENVIPNATLLSADLAPNFSERFRMLTVENPVGSFDNQRYVIDAVLYNNTGNPVTLDRVVVTLESASGSVTGYRVMIYNEVIENEARLPIQVEVIPTVLDEPRVSLYIEAR